METITTILSQYMATDIYIIIIKKTGPPNVDGYKASMTPKQ